MQNRERSDYDSVISSYFGEGQVTAVINLKVETKDADVIAEAIAEHANVEALYLVTGETDLIAVVRFQSYPQLKRFLTESITSIPGVKESKTAMVVTTFKEGGELKYEAFPAESSSTEK
ncbi:MAG TPA: Lrp/AsnC ligand binding domain-containing protein [Methanomassiliicoccaceae archaeon]|nr:Lrp/AsnC ligand binding domain-containing protein [Methanomassiliicoccaceae archaeon]